MNSRDVSPETSPEEWAYLVEPRLPDGTPRFVRAWWEDDMPIVDLMKPPPPKHGPRPHDRRDR